MDRGSVEQLATDSPIALLDFHDPHPGDRTKGFAFDLDQRFGDLLDQLLLLIRRKDVLDDVDGD